VNETGKLFEMVILDLNNEVSLLTD
jgi:hypothetical protein